MNKSELISAISVESGLTNANAKSALEATIKVIQDTLIKGDKIQLVGFGTFKVSERAARKGRNPRTGEEIDIAASKVATFSCGSDFKDKLN